MLSRSINVLLALFAFLTIGSFRTSFAAEDKQEEGPSNALTPEILKAFDDMHRAHVEYYSPKKEVFDQYMQRDLNKHFSALYKATVNVSYEMLQPEAIQIGVGFPYYYVWVKILNSDHNVLDQGLVGVRGEGPDEFGVGRLMKPDELNNGQFPNFFNESLRQNIRKHVLAAQGSTEKE